MRRDTRVGRTAPMRNSGTQASHDRSSCLENPRPEGAESSLTENVTSPFQAEPAHLYCSLHDSSGLCRVASLFARKQKFTNFVPYLVFAFGERLPSVIC